MEGVAAWETHLPAGCDPAAAGCVCRGEVRRVGLRFLQGERCMRTLSAGVGMGQSMLLVFKHQNSINEWEKLPCAAPLRSCSAGRGL